MQYEIVKSMPVDKQTGVISDEIVRLTKENSKQKYPEEFRMVVYEDFATGNLYRFITNHLGYDALTIAELYRERWNVELFFYVKHIVMRSDWKSISDYQGDTKTLLRSTSHNIGYFFRPLSQSRRF